MTPEPDLAQYLAACQSRVELALQHWLPSDQVAPAGLHAAMRYAALGDGKRIRPVLVYAAGLALGTAAERLDGAACAVELIHAYSLVHDDLPAMDDDALRRGRPTCHKAYGEALAILAGDALQTLAFQVLCRDTALQVRAETRLAMLDTLAQAAGSRGMAGGQALDIAAEGQDIGLAELEQLHIHKTGALIRASVRLACLAAEAADAAHTDALDHYAKHIGLAFQVQDDILDVAGDTRTLGKTGGKDAAAEKPTYPALLGLQGARAKAAELIAGALDWLAPFGPEADPLRQLAGFVVQRQK